MALYSDIILDQVKKMGQPKTTTQTSTGTVEAQRNEPPDIGSLMMMLMMMGAFQPDQNQALPFAGTEGIGNMPGALNSPVAMPQQSAGTSGIAQALAGGGSGGMGQSGQMDPYMMAIINALIGG